ncbi:RHS repeat protein, partial [Myxococcota bacterium]|nr:RHS repeat protein [Myxococcota bacterium]
MAVVIGGDGSGLLDTSSAILKRGDATRAGEAGQNERIFVNTSNGNLVIQQEDLFLPSLGEDSYLLRTYNSRGEGGESSTGRWFFSSQIKLEATLTYPNNFFELRLGDGSLFEFTFDSDRDLWVSTDGDGPYQTISEISDSWEMFEARYALTQKDGTVLHFDFRGTLVRSLDPNGVSMEYVYNHDTLQLQRVLDDDGHVIEYHYDPTTTQLDKITDETGSTLVDYEFDAWGDLLSVTDRMGHVTRYEYHPQGMLTKIILPNEQTVEGKLETYAAREIEIAYEMLDWRQADRWASYGVSRVTDAEGGITTFDYEFDVEY